MGKRVSRDGLWPNADIHFTCVAPAHLMERKLVGRGRESWRKRGQGRMLKMEGEGERERFKRTTPPTYNLQQLVA